MPDLTGLGDLSLLELRVLVSAGFYASPLSPAQISEVLRYDPSSVSRAADSLEKAGMIERLPNPQDTRSVWLKLTPRGEKLTQAFAEKVKTVFSGYEVQMAYSLTREEKLNFMKTFLKISRRAETMKQLCASGR